MRADELQDYFGYEAETVRVDERAYSQYWGYVVSDRDRSSDDANIEAACKPALASQQVASGPIIIFLAGKPENNKVM